MAEKSSADFRSFWMGGFECSTHRRRDGKRLDVLASSGHDVHAATDYRLLADHGMRTVRDGIRWHLIEPSPGSYDFTSLLPMVRAAHDTGTQVIWDLFHYGYPDDLDIFSPAFVDRFARLAGAVAQLIHDETGTTPYYVPINEISFYTWVAGDVGAFFPFQHGRGFELKGQLVRATIAAIEAIRAVDSHARIAVAEPLINIQPRSDEAADIVSALRYTDAQFEAVDFLAGKARPELGGGPQYLDIVGLNFYNRNQWVDMAPPVMVGDPRYVPLSELLARVAARVERPLFIAETGNEGDARAPWLRYVAGEVFAARAAGINVEGICLYPILSHLGWDDDRHCPNGMFEAFGPDWPRTVDEPLAAELTRLEALRCE